VATTIHYTTQQSHLFSPFLLFVPTLSIMHNIFHIMDLLISVAEIHSIPVLEPAICLHFLVSQDCYNLCSAV